jgi:predicted enzyme related to lactoylglutathione lyase
MNMNNPFTTPGAFSWSELITRDPEMAQGFYAELFGWQVQDMGADMGNYRVVSLGTDQGIGGIMSIPPGVDAPPAWGVYVTVADTDASVAKALALGATLLMAPMDIPGVGRFAWLKDPQGAAFAVIAYRMEAGGS